MKLNIISTWLCCLLIILTLTACSQNKYYNEQINLVSDTINDGIKVSDWEIKQFRNGYVISAISFDDSQLEGMKTGTPIWYVEASLVYAVNGKAQTVSSATEAPKEIQDAILHPNLKKNEEIKEVPTIEELAIFEYYENRLMDEADKFYAAQDTGSHYQYVTIRDLEGAIAKEVAAKYGLSVEDLNAIYLKVSIYKYT